MTDTSLYEQTAKRVCTERELEALRLRDEVHLSPRAIAFALGVSRWSIRDRLDNADRKIAAEFHCTLVA